MTLSRRGWLRVVLGVGLALFFVACVANPGNILPTDLRDNLIAETLGAAFTLLVVDLLFEAESRREAKHARDELSRSLEHTFDADLHALWSLLLAEPLAREDALRHAPRRVRIERFLRDLATDAVWANAPAAHAKAVRGRLRDLGGDAERMLVLSETVVPIDVRAKLDDVRRACRTMDEAWDTIARGALAQRFAREVAPAVRAAMGAIDERAAA